MFSNKLPFVDVSQLNASSQNFNANNQAMLQGLANSRPQIFSREQEDEIRRLIRYEMTCREGELHDRNREKGERRLVRQLGWGIILAVLAIGCGAGYWLAR